MKKILHLSLIILAFSSCNKCKDMDCFTPPQTFSFQFVDSTTGVDLFMTGVLDTNIFDARDADHHKIDYQKHSSNNSLSLIFYTIGWNTGTHDYTFTLDSSRTMKLTLNMEEMHENCCTFFRRNSMKIEPYSWSENSSTGIIKIKIPN